MRKKCRDFDPYRPLKYQESMKSLMLLVNLAGAFCVGDGGKGLFFFLFFFSFWSWSDSCEIVLLMVGAE